MLGDTASVFRTSYSDATILADSNLNAKTLFRPESQIEGIKTLSLSYSKRLSDVWQLGLSMPVVSKTRMLNREWRSREGVGDLTLVAAYKLIPEYRRNVLFTRGFIYSSFKFANAPSLFTTKNSDLLDTRGNGHEVGALGLMGMKRNDFGILSMQTQIAYRPSKNFSASQGVQSTNVTTKSSWDSLVSLAQSVPLMAGVNLDFSLSRSYTSNQTTSIFIGRNQESLAYTSSLGVSYSYGDFYDFTLNYSDDFLVGPAINHTLSRSVSIGFVSKTNL